MSSNHSKQYENEEANSAVEYAYENDEWGRSQVDAEDPFFLQEQMHLLEKNRKEIAKIREKDEKFTPIRAVINISSILLLLCGLAHIITSAIVIKSSRSRFIGGLYAGILTFLAGLYPTNHFQEVPIIWLILLTLLSFVSSVISCIYEEADLSFVSSLKACVNEDYSQYTGSSSYYKAVYICQSTSTAACTCINRSNVCYPYEKLPSRECANLINNLPTEIRASYLVAIISSVFSGTLMCLSIVAYLYPSIISIWLLWDYITHCKEMKEISHSRPHEVEMQSHLVPADTKPERNVLEVPPHKDNSHTIQPVTVEEAASSAAAPRLAVHAFKRYKGEVEEASGKKHGFGMFTYDNGDVYEGYFVMNKKHGMGTYRYANGDVFAGSFEAGLKHGRGRYGFKASGDVYEGDYLSGVIHGHGIYSYGDGARYEGSFEQGVKQGQGVHSFPSGARYEGQWARNVAHGQGRYMYPSGRVYSGGFTDGRMDSELVGEEANQLELSS